VKLSTLRRFCSAGDSFGELCDHFLLHRVIVHPVLITSGTNGESLPRLFGGASDLEMAFHALKLNRKNVIQTDEAFSFDRHLLYD